MSPALDTPIDAPESNPPLHPPSSILNHEHSDKTRTNPSLQHWTPAAALTSLPSHERPPFTTNKTGPSTSPSESCSAPPPPITTPIPFLHLLTRLKSTKREGWRRFGISHGESIADHMYRMSLMTLVAPRSLTSRLDMARCTRMALVHDMAELLVGDITPLDKVDKAEKSRRESETVDWLCGDAAAAGAGVQSMLGGYDGGIQGHELRELWREYETGVSEESKFVHDVDKVELVLQMVEYERANGGNVDLGEFAWVAGRVVLPECRAWVREVLRERDVFWEGVGRVPENGKGTALMLELERSWSEEMTAANGSGRDGS